jgi:hypothetical protein
MGGSGDERERDRALGEQMEGGEEEEEEEEEEDEGSDHSSIDLHTPLP